MPLLRLNGLTGYHFTLTLSLTESIMESCKAVLAFESVDEILGCDHSNEISLAVLLLGIICFCSLGLFSNFYFDHYYE